MKKTAYIAPSLLIHPIRFNRLLMSSNERSVTMDTNSTSGVSSEDDLL